jgi:hypothetical protein
LVSVWDSPRQKRGLFFSGAGCSGYRRRRRRNRLRAGEAISFSKLWGFTVRTGHQHVRYTFHTGWHGVDTAIRQCRTQWIDVLP